MPLSTQIIIKGITDAKFTPDGGTAVDVFAIQSIKFSGQFDEKVVKGDDKVLDYFSELESAAIDLNTGAFDLDGLGSLLGVTAVQAGTTPSQTATLDILAQEMPYGKLEGQATKVVGHGGDAVGDVHFVIYKFKISKFDFEAKTDEALVISGSGIAIPDDTNKLLTVIGNETATDIT